MDARASRGGGCVVSDGTELRAEAPGGEDAYDGMPGLEFDDEGVSPPSSAFRPPSLLLDTDDEADVSDDEADDHAADEAGFNTPELRAKLRDKAWLAYAARAVSDQRLSRTANEAAAAGSALAPFREQWLSQLLSVFAYGRTARMHVTGLAGGGPFNVLRCLDWLALAAVAAAAACKVASGSRTPAPAPAPFH